MANFFQVATQVGVLSSTGAPAVAVSLDVPPNTIAAGNYTFSWLAEIRLTAVVAGAFAQADLFFMGVSVYQTSFNDDQWHIVSGSGGAAFAANATPLFQLILSRQGNAATAEMRKGRLTFLQEST